MNANPKPHKQVVAKVNAYVDEGVKELVEPLANSNRTEPRLLWFLCNNAGGALSVPPLYGIFSDALGSSPSGQVDNPQATSHYSMVSRTRLSQ